MAGLVYSHRSPPVPSPALTEGTRLGPYEVLAAIGAGGMGEVYRARDTRLDRSGRQVRAARGEGEVVEVLLQGRTG